MDATELKSLQRPLKERYREAPEEAVVRLHATGDLRPETVTCKIETDAGVVEAGLHPKTGGNGEAACSGDMLLQALAACAGVTLTAVAKSMGIGIADGSVRAEADFDARGTLGVDREAPVGLTNVTLDFKLETDADDEKLEKLLEMTERYCVVMQTICREQKVESRVSRA